jgi:hypothetical protein
MKSAPARIVLTAVSLVLVALHSARADTITVTPLQSIQAAIDAATYGDTVEVAPGTYSESITLKDGVALIGAGPDVTIIHADPNTSAVTAMICESDTLLQGFTIQNGTGTELSEPGVTLGGGIFVQYSSLWIVDCVFRNNTATAYGGAICNFMNANPVVVDCIFTNNHCDAYGGAVAGYGFCAPAYINCIFVDNTAAYGAALAQVDLYPAAILNCTFTRNQADSTGGAVFNMSPQTMITNSILWANDPNQIYDYEGYLTPTNSIIQGGYGQPEDNNLDTDPMLLSADDLRLQFDSPAIDAGDNEAIPPELNITTDIDNRPRLVDGDCDDIATIDIGAHEFNHIQIGDLNTDCAVDYDDLTILADNWLTGNPIVNFQDLTILAKNWLKGIE